MRWDGLSLPDSGVSGVRQPSVRTHRILADFTPQLMRLPQVMYTWLSLIGMVKFGQRYRSTGCTGEYIAALRFYQFHASQPASHPWPLLVLEKRKRQGAGQGFVSPVLSRQAFSRSRPESVGNPINSSWCDWRRTLHRAAVFARVLAASRIPLRVGASIVLTLPLPVLLSLAGGGELG